MDNGKYLKTSGESKQILYPKRFTLRLCEGEPGLSPESVFVESSAMNIPARPVISATSIRPGDAAVAPVHTPS